MGKQCSGPPSDLRTCNTIRCPGTCESNVDFSYVVDSFGVLSFKLVVIFSLITLDLFSTTMTGKTDQTPKETELSPDGSENQPTGFENEGALFFNSLRF